MLVSVVPLVLATPLLAFAAPANRRFSSGAGIAVPIQKRLSSRNASDVVSSEVLQRKVSQAVAKYQEGFAAFEANTRERHPLDFRSSNPQAKRGVGSVPLMPDGVELWYGSISVGTPAKTFTVDFDTGSSDLFLPGPSCGATCAGHSIYDPTQSSTSSDIHKSFQLKFGDGSSVQAEAYEDVVSVAGMPAIGQALGVSSTYSTGFGIPSFPPDGLLGLGFPSISKFGQPPVFNTLIAEGILNAPAFGVYLADSGGELFLGGTNPNLYQGGFTFVPVTKEAYWQVTLDEITVDDRPVLLSTFPVIIDTGTTLLVGPPQEVAAVYAQIPGALPYVREIANGLYTIPCDFNYTLALTFGGRSFSIDPSTFNQGPADDTPGRCFAGLAFDPDLTLEGFWIIGDVFLRNVYTVFDAGSSHVGFASLAYPTS